MIPFFKVLHIKDGIETNLNKYVLDLNISQGTEAKKNSITINLTNANSKLNSQEFIVDESTIKCYLSWEPITTQDPVISAVISSIDYGLDAKGKAKIKLKATDKTGLFLSKLWSQAILESAGKKANEAVIDIIGHLNGFDEGTNITTNNVATTKSDGTPFTFNVNISKTWKPGYEWLNELSQTEYTKDDRAYVYWIDEDNDLHWQYPFQKPLAVLSSDINSVVTTIPISSTSGWPNTGSFVIDSEIIDYTGKTSNSFTGCIRGSGFSSANSHSSGANVSGQVIKSGEDPVYKMDEGTSDEGTYNFIIYNAGETPAGYEYLDYTLNYDDIGKKFKMKFYDWKQISNDLSDSERRNTGYGDTTSSYPTTYPYTTEWTDVDGNQVTVANDGEYQDAFITEIIRRAQTKASAFFIGGQLSWKAKVQMRGNLNYKSNELVYIDSPKYDFLRLLRIKDIKHQVNRTGWITDIEFDTDPAAVSA